MSIRYRIKHSSAFSLLSVLIILRNIYYGKYYIHNASFSNLVSHKSSSHSCLWLVELYISFKQSCGVQNVDDIVTIIAAMCHICALVFLSLLGFVDFINGQSNAVEASPFFFNCKQFDRLPNNWDPYELSMKTVQVEMAGNPRSYIGGQVYKGIFCKTIDLLVSPFLSS